MQAIALLLAAVYYVAPAGNDSNPGTESLPWRTIGKAALTMSAGDTAYIRAGTYSEAVSAGQSGAPGAWITYAAYPGESPVLDGTVVSLPEYTGLFHVESRNYIRVSGLTITNSGPNDTNAAILVDGAEHIVIENNSTYMTRSSGIGVWNSRDVVASGNDIRQCCIHGGSNECISIGTTDGFEVKYNKVHDGGDDVGGGEGICLKDGSSNGSAHHNEVYDRPKVGIYLDAWDKHTFNIDVHTNVVHDMKGEGIAIASEMGGLLENARIYNNVVYRAGFNGINFGYYGGDVPTRPVRNIVVINNTIYDNGRSGWGGGISIDNPDARDIVIRNNIICGNESFQIVAGVPVPGLIIDHNLIHEFRGYENETRGLDFVEHDPLFANAAALDFHLAPGSPAIDAGSSAGAPAVDFAGRARPRGKGHDLGAYEYPSPGKRRAVRSP